MLASITPLGQRGRGASWRRTVTFYLLGSVVAAAAVGAVMGAVGAAVGSTVPTWLVVGVGAAAFIGAGSDLRGRPPSLQRQVDEAWLDRYRDWVHGGGFGLQLGLGVVTIVTSASIYLMLLLELLVGDPAQSALVGAMFGVARAVPVLSTAGVHEPRRLRTVHRQWQRRLPAVRVATVALQTAAGAALIVVGMR